MVYVGKNEYKLGRMIMCHMIADTLKELHQMADLIKVDRKHFQNKKGKPHYDICKQNKELVIENGAKEVSDREIIRILNNRELLLHLVDVVWGDIHENESVPATIHAERLIQKAKGRMGKIKIE